MAFALAQTWNAAAQSPGGASAPASVPGLSDKQQRYFRRGAAIFFSILVHLLLLWMLLNKLAGGAVQEGESAASRRDGFMSFALSDPAASASRNDPRQVREPRVERAAVSEVDATAPTTLPPPEWTVSRLPPAATPRPAAASAGALAGTSAGAGNSTLGSGRGGSGVYDPYAGAAPLRNDAAGASANGSLGARVLGFLGLGQAGAAALSLDETALETIRSTVERSLPGRKGTAEIMVRVSPTGMVLEASVRGGSAPAEARGALGRALIGKRLFSGSAPGAQILTLPVLRLG